MDLDPYAYAYAYALAPFTLGSFILDLSYLIFHTCTLQPGSLRPRVLCRQ